jgi:hypothetical protein
MAKNKRYQRLFNILTDLDAELQALGLDLRLSQDWGEAQDATDGAETCTTTVILLSTLDGGGNALSHSVSELQAVAAARS